MTEEKSIRPEELNAVKSIGTHVGVCVACDFSLIADTDKECPRCLTEIRQDA